MDQETLTAIGDLIDKVGDLFTKQQDELDAIREETDPEQRAVRIKAYNESVAETDALIDTLLESDKVSEEDKAKLRELKHIDKIAAGDITPQQASGLAGVNTQKNESLKEIAGRYEEDEEAVVYDDGEYFEKFLQQIRCAYISGEDAIAIPEKYLGIKELVIGDFTYELI